MPSEWLDVKVDEVVKMAQVHVAPSSSKKLLMICGGITLAALAVTLLVRTQLQAGAVGADRTAVAQSDNAAALVAPMSVPEQRPQNFRSTPFGWRSR